MFAHNISTQALRSGTVASAIGLCALLWPLNASAQETQIDCQNAMTQYDMNTCAGREFNAADGDLNATYQLAMNDWFGGRTTAHGQALLAAQRAWLAYRDAHCSAEAAQFEGGSMQPMIHAFCLAELTRTRTETIRSYAEPY